MGAPLRKRFPTTGALVLVCGALLGQAALEAPIVNAQVQDANMSEEGSDAQPVDDAQNLPAGDEAVDSAEQLEAEGEVDDGLSWIAFIAPIYSPDTGFGLVVPVGLYWKMDPESSPSSAQMFVTYSFRNQVLFQAQPELWLNGNALRLWGDIEVLYYPDLFYGIGPDTPDRAEEKFTLTSVNPVLGAEFEIIEGFRIGPQIAFRYDSVTDVEEGGLLSTGDILGSDAYFASGLGATLSWDTRDSVFYPTRGTLIRSGGLIYNGLIGSDLDFGTLSFDARQFVNIAGIHIFGFQAFIEGSGGQTPFEALPYLGGAIRHRGFPANRYRDNIALYVQAEYRFPIWWRFGGVVFAGVGNVTSNLFELSFDNLKPAAGVGLRIRINDLGVNGRVDFAMSSFGPAFYLTALEAF